MSPAEYVTANSLLEESYKDFQNTHLPSPMLSSCNSLFSQSLLKANIWQPVRAQSAAEQGEERRVCSALFCHSDSWRPGSPHRGTLLPAQGTSSDLSHAVSWMSSGLTVDCPGAYRCPPLSRVRAQVQCAPCTSSPYPISGYVGYLPGPLTQLTTADD